MGGMPLSSSPTPHCAWPCHNFQDFFQRTTGISVWSVDIMDRMNRKRSEVSSCRKWNKSYITTERFAVSIKKGLRKFSARHTPPKKNRSQFLSSFVCPQRTAMMDGPKISDVGTANGNLMYDLNVAFRNFEKKNSPLRLGKKIYEFYTAPVTKFWLHTVRGFLHGCLATMGCIQHQLLGQWESTGKLNLGSS